MRSRLLGAVCVGLFSLGLVSTVDAALVSRLGGLAYYDTVLNITWLQDANYANTTGYGPADFEGKMDWADANAWAAGLSIAGVGGWRLPDTAPVDGGPLITIFQQTARRILAITSAPPARPIPAARAASWPTCTTIISAACRNVTSQEPACSPRV